MSNAQPRLIEKLLFSSVIGTAVLLALGEIVTSSCDKFLQISALRTPSQELTTRALMIFVAPFLLNPFIASMILTVPFLRFEARREDLRPITVAFLRWVKTLLNRKRLYMPTRRRKIAPWIDARPSKWEELRDAICLLTDSVALFLDESKLLYSLSEWTITRFRSLRCLGKSKIEITVEHKVFLLQRDNLRQRAEAPESRGWLSIPALHAFGIVFCVLNLTAALNLLQEVDRLSNVLVAKSINFNGLHLLVNPSANRAMTLSPVLAVASSICYGLVLRHARSGFQRGAIYASGGLISLSVLWAWATYAGFLLAAAPIPKVEVTGIPELAPSAATEVYLLGQNTDEVAFYVLDLSKRDSKGSPARSVYYIKKAKLPGIIRVVESVAIFDRLENLGTKH